MAASIAIPFLSKEDLDNFARSVHSDPTSSTVYSFKLWTKRSRPRFISTNGLEGVKMFLADWQIEQLCLEGMISPFHPDQITGNGHLCLLFLKQSRVPTMSLCLIAQMSINLVIARDDKPPWYIPEDMAFFRETTEGHPVIMGRKTWESLPKRPLVNRPNIVISKHLDSVPGATVVDSPHAALDAAYSVSDGDVFCDWWG